MSAAVEIQRTLDVFKTGQLVEVRAVGKAGLSGYYRDFSNLLRCIDGYPNETFYFVLNEINEQCYAKEQRETLVKGVKSATADCDITWRQWVLVDVDPVRAAGISSSADEKKAALDAAGRLHNYMRDIGFEAPVVADSGNGYHLLYRAEMENSTENTDLVRRFLSALDMMFSDDRVEIDTAVYNASRITKLYGTMARKGANTPERPHRLSRLVRVPDEIKPTSVALFKLVVDMIPEPEKPTYRDGYKRFDLRGFMQANGLRVAREAAYRDGTRFVLEECPFDPSHKAPDAAIFEAKNGAMGFKCFHNSCSEKDWRALREHFEPGVYQRLADQPRTHVAMPIANAPKIVPRNGDEIPPFIQLHEISYRDRSQVVSVKTGFTSLDKKLIGMNKGELSLWSGGNGSGKSTLLNQLGIESVQQGFHVALFSGELTGSRVKEWVHLQSAGRQFTKPSQFGNLFYTPRQYGDLIDEWLKGKLWLYNNPHGTCFRTVIDSIEKKISEQTIDVVILDNLMSLDLTDLSGDKWERQTRVALELSALAKTHNVHIHFVCHPRKPSGFLRKADVGGTADLTNAADNVFMAHRVNRDFKRNAGEFFGVGEAHKYFEYDNVVECMKNRDMGVEDYLVGLYYEPQSKRYLNERFENRVYGWMDLIPRDDWVAQIERDVVEGKVEEWTQ